MASIINQLIEYDGIDICTVSSYKYFRQFNKEQILCIPVQKPDIEQIVKVWAKASILKHSVIRTPVGVSLEGQVMTGYKLFVLGEIHIKYQYVADYVEQSVHTAEGTIPFCEYVVLPENFSESQTIFPHVAIEDIFCKQLDCRCINNNFTLMLIANLC